MKTQISLITIVLFVGFTSFARGGGGGHHSSSHSSSGATHVSGYTKKNGTYVEAHRRTKANETTKDNWSHKGNVNPDTGAAGTKDD